MTTDSDTQTQQSSVPDAAEAPKPAEARHVGLMETVGIAVVVSALMATAVVAAARYFSPAPQMVTVDLSEVVQIKEVQLATLAARAGTSDRERAGIYDEIAVFGKQLEDALQAMEADCNCVIFVRPAVIKGAQDVTENLKQRVGLGGATLPRAVAELRGGSGGYVPPQGTGLPQATPPSGASAQGNGVQPQAVTGGRR